MTTKISDDWQMASAKGCVVDRQSSEDLEMWLFVIISAIGSV